MVIVVVGIDGAGSSTTRCGLAFETEMRQNKMRDASIVMTVDTGERNAIAASTKVREWMMEILIVLAMTRILMADTYFRLQCSRQWMQ